MKKLIVTIILSTLIGGVAHSETNVRVNPLAMLLGMIDMGLDFQMGNSWVLGPTGSFIFLSAGTTKITGYDLGARATFYTNNVFTDSWFISPSIRYGSIQVKSDTASSDLTGFGGALTFGYAWFWPSSFNIHLGLGVRYFNYPESSNGLDVSLSGTGPSLTFDLGFVF